MVIGVIGCGWWGKNIVNSLETIDAVERVVVVEPDVMRHDVVRHNTKVTFADSVDALLADAAVEAVCIATPPATHRELTERALLAGRHTLVEKPPAYAPDEVRALGALARERGLVYMLDALYLFLEPVRKLKAIMESGLLTDIRMIQMFRIGDELRREGSGIQRIQTTMFDNGTDVIEDLFFHDAGILLHLFDGLELTAVRKRHLYHPAHADTAVLEFTTGGTPIELTLSWTLAGRRRGMVIYDRNVIVEYDGLVPENQISVTTLAPQLVERFSFPNTPPLGALLEYFIATTRNPEGNMIGDQFMYSIMHMWNTVQS